MSKFQTKIIKEYKSKGYTVLNIIKLSDSGYPDLLALKDGIAIWIECKEKNDTLKPLQKLRIDELINNGFKAFCLQDTKGKIYPLCKHEQPKTENYLDFPALKIETELG